MHKVSVMLEADDALYDAVIEPLKRCKKFTEVLKILLNGYMTDGYIAQYVEGTQDAYKQKTEEDLLDALDVMKETLAQLSLSNEEAKSYVDAGISSFTNSADRSGFTGSESSAKNPEILALLEDKAQAEERHKQEILEAEERHKQEIDDFKRKSDEQLEKAKEEIKNESTRQLEAIKKEMEEMISMAFRKGVVNPTKREKVEEGVNTVGGITLDTEEIVPEKTVKEETAKEETPIVAAEPVKVVPVEEELIKEEPVTKESTSEEIINKAHEISNAPVESIPVSEEKELAEDDPLSGDVFEVPDDDDELNLFGEEEESFSHQDSLDFLNNLLEGQVKSF